MIKLIVLVMFCLVAVMSMPYGIYEDEEGNQYVLVSHERVRRQDRVFDGKFYAKVPKGGRQPDNVGASGSLTWQSTGNGVKADVFNKKKYGTDVYVGGNRNLWQSKDGRTRIDATAGASKHFQGGHSSRPDYKGGISLSTSWTACLCDRRPCCPAGSGKPLWMRPVPVHNFRDFRQFMN